MINFDNTQAMEEGWCISEVGSTEPFRLEKLDEANKFDSDDQAHLFVVVMSFVGSSYHRSALQFLYDHSRPEYDRIAQTTIKSLEKTKEKNNG